MPPRAWAVARLGLVLGLVCGLVQEASATVQPDLDVNFADITTNANWITYATANLINFSENWDNCGIFCIKQSDYYGFFNGAVEGYMRFQIPSGYDTIEVKFRTYDDFSDVLGQDVNMYVLSDSTITSGFDANTPIATSVGRATSDDAVAVFQNVILTKPDFQAGQYVYIVEDGGLIDPNIRIQFKNTLPATPTPAPAAAACPTTASGTVDATTTVPLNAWNADMKAHALTSGQTLDFSPQHPRTLDVSRGFTAVVLARPDAAGRTGDLVTLKDTNTNTIARLGADAGAVAVECPDGAGTVDATQGAELHAQAEGLGVYALVASDDSCVAFTQDCFVRLGTVDVQTTNSFNIDDACLQLARDAVTNDLQYDAGGEYDVAVIKNSDATRHDVKIVVQGTPAGDSNRRYGSDTASPRFQWSDADTIRFSWSTCTGATKVYAPDASGSFLHAGADVSGCGGFGTAGTAGALAGGYSLTLGGSAFAGLLGEAFVAPRALSRAELGLAIHGLAAYAGEPATGDFDRWYTFDGDLHSYHDRAARRRAAAEHEAEAVVDSMHAEQGVAATDSATLTLPFSFRTYSSQANHATIANSLSSAERLPTKAELKAYFASFGADLAGNFWVPVWADAAQSTRDWLHAGGTGHPLGKSSIEALPAGLGEANGDSRTDAQMKYYTVPTSASAYAVHTPAPDRRLYALDVAVRQTLVAPVDGAFAWTGAWTVAAWLHTKVPKQARNLALSILGATAHLSSVYNDLIKPDEAIDGLIHQVWDSGPGRDNEEKADCALAATSDQNPTLMVDLKRTSKIERVKVYGRTDSNFLNTDFTIRVGNSDQKSGNPVCYTDQSGGLTYSESYIREVPCIGIGRYVSIETGARSSTPLSICEFQVFGVDAELMLSDGASPPVSAAVVTAEDLTVGGWTHVALTHAATDTDILLHVNGGAGASTGINPSAWAAGGSVQITGAALDDLRVFSGQALTLEEVQTIAGATVDANAPVARWDFENANALGAATYGPHITISGTPVERAAGNNALELTAGQTLVAPVLGAFDWTGPWTVAAWLKVQALASGAVLQLQDGANPANTADAVTDASVTAGAWTHVALTHAATDTDILLHVNGGAGASTGIDPRAWAAGGSLQITGAAVDDLRVYQHDYSARVQDAGAPPPPPVTYDFTSANDVSAWTLKAKEIDARATSHENLAWSGDWSSTILGLYSSDSREIQDGYVKFALPSAYNTITITSGNDFDSAAGTVYLYIDTQTSIDAGTAVPDFTWGQMSSSTRWFSYTDGDWLMLKENNAVILGDTIMTFSYLASSYGFCDDTDPDAASCAALLPAIPGDTGGWRLVRHIPASTCTTSGGTETCTGYWYTGNDNLVGSDVRAPDSDYAVAMATASGDVQWTKRFDNFNFDEYLISTGDKARWLQFAKTELVKVTTTGSSSAQNPAGNIINSHLGTTQSTFITWWRDTVSNAEDPNIYYPTNDNNDVFYQEHNPDPGDQHFWTNNRMIPLKHGMNVFVRDSTAAGGGGGS